MNSFENEATSFTDHKTDYTTADNIVNYARASGMQARGVALVWHNSLPPWLNGCDQPYPTCPYTAAQLQGLLHDHVVGEAGHFRGRIYQWDVVNEGVQC